MINEKDYDIKNCPIISEEDLLEIIKFCRLYGEINGECNEISNIKILAEQVLKVEGFPEKKECFVVHRPKDYTCPSCEMFHSCPHCLEAEGFNDALAKFKLLVARDYVHKDDYKVDLAHQELDDFTKFRKDHIHKSRLLNEEDYLKILHKYQVEEGSRWLEEGVESKITRACINRQVEKRGESND